MGYTDIANANLLKDREQRMPPAGVVAGLRIMSQARGWSETRDVEGERISCLIGQHRHGRRDCPPQLSAHATPTGLKCGTRHNVHMAWDWTKCRVLYKCDGAGNLHGL